MEKLRKDTGQELEYLPIEESGQLYAHSDLGASAALLVSGFELASLERDGSRRVKFIFKGRDGIAEAMDAYWNNALPVDAQSYFNALKRLKNQIYSN